MRRWIITLGSVKLTLWLLLSMGALLFIGAYYTGAEFNLFRTLNETRLQTWLFANAIPRFGVVWWIFALCIAAVLIAINTMCCLFLRVETLIARRRELPMRRLAILLIPSIVHLLFCLLLFGHLITLTTGSWDRIKIAPGSAFTIAGNTGGFTVSSIDNRNFNDGLLEGRLAQATVTLRNEVGKTTYISHLEPQEIGGRTVFLTMGKRRKPNVSTSSGEHQPCDTLPSARVNDRARPQQELLVVSDPGFYLIITVWFAAVALMGLFFLVRWREGAQKKPS